MKAFFGSLKSKSNQKIRLPRYLDKLGYYSIIDRMCYKPNNKYYKLPRGHFIKKISKYFTLTKKDNYLSSSLNLIEELNIIIETPKCIINKQIKEITIKQKFDGKYIYVIHTYIEEDVFYESNLKTESMVSQKNESFVKHKTTSKYSNKSND